MINPAHVQRFEALLTDAYRDLFLHDPEYAYSASRTTAAALAGKMTAGLARGNANKDGEGIKRVCKAIGIPYTYKAITAYLHADGD
jgi:hypothetical protein